MTDFIQFTATDIIDIVVIGLLIYYVYKVIRGTMAMTIFFGIIVFYFIYLLVKSLQMELLSSIMGQVMNVGVLALFIVFQHEIRIFLLHLGSRYTRSTKRFRLLQNMFNRSRVGMSLHALDEITQACRKMSETNTGALIVLTRHSALEFIAETGDQMDARLSRRLIENIFFKNSPLHDGAMIITRERIAAARCTLPMSDSLSIPAHLGMRHRAAVGVSEQTDAVAIVVSEETGEISVVQSGIIKKMSSITELRIAIETAMKE
jgi:TIGR00159 family protein